MDPTKKKKCKPDQRLNSANRCVSKFKPCKEHQVRNAKNRCVNRVKGGVVPDPVPDPDPVPVPSRVDCPPGSVLNWDGRCVIAVPDNGSPVRGNGPWTHPMRLPEWYRCAHNGGKRRLCQNKPLKNHLCAEHQGSRTFTRDVQLINMAEKCVLSDKVVRSIAIHRHESCRTYDGSGAGRFDKAWRQERWAEIVKYGSKVIPNANFTHLTSEQVIKLFQVYDAIFFGGTLWRKMCHKSLAIHFGVSQGKLPGNTAAYVTRSHREMRLQYASLIINETLFTSLFTSPSQAAFRIGNMRCESRRECLFHAFGHELIHLVRARFCHGQEDDPHGPKFMRMLYNMFGQSSDTHDLTPDMALTT